VAQICENCGFEGEPIKKRPGSTTTQLILFVIGLFTGVGLIAWLVYVIWRAVKTEMVCPSCQQAKTMILVSSPKGLQLQKQFQAVAR